jgi:hypothetical protein
VNGESNNPNVFLIVIFLILLFPIAGLWMRLYWRVIDPAVRKLLGRLLGVEVNLGEQSIWQINLEPVDSMNWRNLFVRPLQMIFLMLGGLIPLLLAVVIVIAVLG